MCLLALCKPGYALTKEHIDNAWEANSDGAGFAYIDHAGNLRVYRSMDQDRFTSVYLETAKMFPESPFLVHFRFGTSGIKDLTNVHPFNLNDLTVMGHNGVLPVAATHGRSDTKTFVEDWLSELPQLWLDTAALRYLIEGFIGTDKLVFLTVDPRLEYTWYILNEDRGDWFKDEKGKDAIWFSNDGYKDPWYLQYRRYSGTTGNTVRAGWDEDADRFDYEAWKRENDERNTVLGLKRPSSGVEGTMPIGIQLCEICKSPCSFDEERESMVCDTCGICWDCGEFFEECICLEDPDCPPGEEEELHALIQAASSAAERDSVVQM